MNIRFTNATILPLVTPTADAVFGDVWVEDGRITLVGAPDPGRQAPAWDRTVDCGGDLLLPAFKNAHTHSAMTFLRSLADGKPLDRWLHEDVFPLEAHLTPDDSYAQTQLAILEYLSSGISVGFDMYYHNDAITAACIDAGFRMALCGAANDYGGTADSLLLEHEKYNALHPLISYRIGIHAEYTTSLPLMRDVAALVADRRLPFCLHLAETRSEVDGCLSRYGVTPARLMDDLGLFAYGGAAFHCVHCDADDRRILGEHGVYAVFNCGSNLKLGSGVAPIAAFHREGVPCALGTDGAASNNALDFFREMHLAAVLPNLTDGVGAVSAADVLYDACCGGAHAMGLEDLDGIAVGKRADLVRIGMQSPNMQPVHDPATNLVYSGSKANVRMTVVDGRILYEDGEFHIGVSPAAVYDRAQKSALSLLRKGGRR